jgi:hypothetical protein
VKLQHLKIYLKNAKHRAARENVPFDLTLQDLVDIATDECPIFHTPFVWGSSGLGKGKVREDTPQLDKIIPSIGYVKGNIAFLSGKANKMKDNGTMQDHYDIADWIWNHIHAKKKSTTQVPAGDHSESSPDAKRRAVFAARLGEDRDDTHHHCGTIRGEDLDHRAQTSSGDSMGCGSEEVGTPQTSKSKQNNGYSCTENPWFTDHC